MKRSLHDYLTGGPVRGPGTPTSDSILARISNGEYVLPKPAVDMVGVGNLEAIRQAALARTPRYALGGIAGLALGSSGQNLQTPGESTSTTFYPPATSNATLLGGLGLSGGMRPSPTQPSGPTNSYGNDLSLTNRMTAGAEAMRTMREGPTTAPQPTQPPDFMTGLKALMNPQQQAQDTYKAARGNADALDVASGRFDREYAPGLKDGGMVSQEQWEGLPRFAQGMSPEDFAKANREQVERIVQGIGSWLTSPADTSRMPGSQFPRLDQPKQPTPAIASAPPQAPRTLAVAPTPNPDANPATRIGPASTVTPPVSTVTPPAIPSLASMVPGGSWQELAQPGEWEQTKQGLQNRNPTPATSVMLQPGAREAGIFSQQVGGKILVNGPGRLGIGPQMVVATPSRQVGTQQYSTEQPFEPSQGIAPPPPLMGDQRIMTGNGVTGPLTMGGSNVPIYQTDYTIFGPKDQQGTLSVTGQNQRVGGGTVSQPDQGNGGTVEGNVAALNRQYEAMKSRNEAYGLGGGNASSALPTVPQSVDIWARPGDSFGDSQMRQLRYESLLENAGKQRGLGAKRRAAAMVDAAQALVAPGVETAKLNAAQQQANNSLAGQLAQAQAQQAASRYNADVGLAGNQYTADATLAGSRLKAAQDAEQNKLKNDIDLANAISTRIGATARNALPAEKQMLLQLVDEYSKLDPKSAAAQRLKLIIDVLNPPKDQASLADEMVARLKEQESK